MSVRSLYRLFADQGLVVAQYIKNRRLDLCARALQNVHDDEKLAGIGYRWGFSDHSHFSTAFKQRFGVTPGNTASAVANYLRSHWPFNPLDVLPGLRAGHQLLPGHFRHFIHRQIVVIRQLLVAFAARGVNLLYQRQRLFILTQRREIAVQRLPTRPCWRASLRVNASAGALSKASVSAAVNSRFLIVASEQIAAGFEQVFHILIDLDMDLMLNFDIHIDGDGLFRRRDFDARRTAGEQHRRRHGQ